MKYLGVKKEILEEKGAVSKEVALQMAEGAMKNANSNISVAVTGIAGPDGGTKEKPVGLVYICVKNGNNYTVEKNIFSGNRHAVRTQTVVRALDMVKNTSGTTAVNIRFRKISPRGASTAAFSPIIRPSSAPSKMELISIMGKR